MTAKQPASPTVRVSLKETLDRLPLPATTKWPEGVWDAEALRHGTMSLLLFAPRGRDYQTPHDQDELYIVHRGSGVFTIDDTRVRFEEGDVLFAPAGKPHRFEKFSDDLTLWVVFWGPKGGER
jgi:mannose-6-phosphate isomerase-like protein (cupin superfamily)